MTTSNAGSNRPTVRLIAERPATDSPPELSPATPASPVAQEVARSTQSRQEYQAQILATMQAVAMVLSARALALLAAVGAFILATMAMTDPSPLKLAVAAGFAAFVFVPTIWLHWRAPQ